MVNEIKQKTTTATSSWHEDQANQRTIHQDQAEVLSVKIKQTEVITEHRHHLNI
jgi:hypothetical protein